MRFSFYPRSPASCLQHVFLFGRPRVSPPPWPDADHRRVHNGDCVHSLNDRPVHASSEHPPPTGGARQKQLDFITAWLFWRQPSSQTWRAILEIMKQECPLAYRQQFGVSVASSGLALYHVRRDELCCCTRLISVPPPLIIDFWLCILFIKMQLHARDGWHTGPYSSPGVVDICW